MTTPCIEIASEEYGSEIFKYENEEGRIAGMKRLAQKAEELKDGIARNYYFDEMREDGDLVGNVEHAAQWNGHSWEFNEYAD